MAGEAEKLPTKEGHVTIDYWRQLGLVPMDRLRKAKITMVGAGGIGSPAALALAKMGVGQLSLYDDDQVEQHNLPNQIHQIQSVGLSKVEALKDLLKGFVGEEVSIEAHEERLGAESKMDGIVVAAVDTMESRKNIWEAVQGNLSVDLFVDARMGGHLLRLYSVNPMNPLEAEEYASTLYSDEDALELPCTEQSIIYTSMVAGSLIANAVKKHIAGEEKLLEVILDLSGYTLLTR